MHAESVPDAAALARLEAQLAALAPRWGIDRDQLMFAAGQRAATRRLRTANRILAAASISLAAALLLVVALPAATHRPRLDSPESSAVAVRSARTPAADLRKNDNAAAMAQRTTGPTNFRLLQALARGLDAPVEVGATSPSVTTLDDESAPPSDNRTLLLRYLEDLTKRV
jgi:hypothetical protein